MKNLKLSFVILLVALGFMNIADAETVNCGNEPYQCLNCTYTFGHYTINYYIAGNGQGGGRIVLDTQKSSGDTYYFNDETTIEDFKNEGGTALVCPTIYISNTSGMNYTIYSTDPGFLIPSTDLWIDSQSSNGRDFLGESLGEIIASMELTFTNAGGGTETANLSAYSSGEIRATVPDGYGEIIISPEITVEHIQNQDPGIYVVCMQGRYCRFLFDESLSPNSPEEDPNEEPEEPAVPEEPVDPNTATPLSICSSPSYRKPMLFLGKILNFVKIIVPIVIIVFGVLDFYKAITSSKDEGLSKAFKSLIIRAIAGVCIFLLPGIVQLVLNMVNEWSDYSNNWCCCTECLLNGDCDVNSCSSDSCRIEGMD